MTLGISVNELIKTIVVCECSEFVDGLSVGLDGGWVS